MLRPLSSRGGGGKALLGHEKKTVIFLAASLIKNLINYVISEINNRNSFIICNVMMIYFTFQ